MALWISCCVIRPVIAVRSFQTTLNGLHSISKFLRGFSQLCYSTKSKTPTSLKPLQATSYHLRSAFYSTLYTQNRRPLSCALISGAYRVNGQIRRVVYSTGTPTNKTLSYTERIKVVLKEYGGVGVAFHTVIALISLGTCYLLVDNGLDVDKILIYFNVDYSSGVKKGASTFAIAYVFHKFLLPIRATITIVSVPVIVRQLRARGWMKGAVAKVKNSIQKKKSN